MNRTIPLRTKHVICLAVGTLVLSPIAGPQAQTRAPNAAFGPSNPFYAQSTLPFEAPPFDKIKDSDYQPAMDAGIAQTLRAIQRDREQSLSADFPKHPRRART